MYKHLPPLKALRVFESAARKMSFSLAAQELFVTQSAVSHQIRQLEQFLGKKLFIRQGKILSLSSAGQLYFPTVQRIFCSLDAVSAKTMGQLSGITRLAVYSSFALKWLVPRLPEFRKLHPEIDLRLTMVTDSDIDLDLLGVDCGISISCDNPAYHFSHLRSEEWFPVCSPELYDSFSQLPFHEAILRYALLEGEHQNYQNDWERLFNKIGLSPGKQQPIHFFSHIILLQQAAIEGQGIALSTKMLARNDIEAGRLVQIPLKFKQAPDIFTHFYLCCALERKNDVAIMALQTWLKNAFEQEEKPF
jgi:LysR family glycine cleavage system transcriptional activator